MEPVSLLNPLKYIVGIFSIGISWVDINRVSFDTRHGNVFVAKSRSPFSGILIALGNCVFRLRRTPVHVLYTAEWIAWEFQIQQTISGEPTEQSAQPPRVLILNKIPGRKLSDLLSQTKSAPSDGLELLGIATKSLFQFHQNRIEFGHDGPIRLSHGDASIQNVLIDEPNQTATWFDFDLRHDLIRPEHLRHADDVRALLFTSACNFKVDHVDEVIKVIKVNYQCPKVWAALKEQVGSRWFKLDVFHASQVRRSRSNGNSRKSAAASLEQIRKILLATFAPD